MEQLRDLVRRLESAADQAGAAAPAQDSLSSVMDTATAAAPPVLSTEEIAVCYVNPTEPIVGHNRKHAGTERFRLLCHRLRQSAQYRPLRSLLVTSLIPREGKTVVALNVAATLAFNTPRVVLVDTDMRRSGVRESLGLPPMKGLADCLEGRASLQEALRRIEPLGIYCLPAGSTDGNPAELLAGAPLRQCIAELGRAFDWVVIDSPPLKPFADAHYIANFADGVLLVMRAGCTPRQGVQQALSSLNGANFVGAVLNSSDEADDILYYGYYGEKRKQEEAAAPAGHAGAAG